LYLLHALIQRVDSDVFADGSAYLQRESEQDLMEITRQIKKSDLEIALHKANTPEEKMRIRFAGTVIVGDSIVEGLVDYRLLDQTQAVYARGRRTDNCEDDIKKAAELAPERVILHYGMNDLEYCGGDSARFLAQYEKVIAQVKKQMPQATIYIHGILPIDRAAIAKTAVYAHWPQFNQALRTLCKKQGITYMDGGFLLTSASDYEFDGIHPKYAFYPKWLLYLLEVME